MCLNNSQAMDNSNSRQNRHEQLEFTEYDENDNCNYYDYTSEINTNQTDLTILQWNIRGLTGKKDVLHSMLTQTGNNRQIDIGIICETWLTDRTQSYAKIPDYNLICSNRNDRQGGGVCFMVSNHLKYRTRPDLTSHASLVENCFIEVLSKNGNIIIGSIYRPPNTSEKEFLQFIIDTIKVSKAEKKELILGLDHNLDLLKSHLHKNTQEFLNLLLDNNLTPTITKPSRITKSTATLIDNIIISRKLANSYECGLIINDNSDHLPCFNILNDVMPGIKRPIEISHRKLTQKVIKNMRTDLLGVNWECLDSMNVNQSFEYFHTILHERLNEHAPLKTIAIRSKKRDEPWLTTSLKRSIQKQQNLYKKTLSHCCENSLRIKYQNYKRTLSKLKRFCKHDYYRNKCIEFKSNTKKLWALINTAIRKNNDKSCVIDCIQSGKLTHYKGNVIAEEFAKYFSTVGREFANRIPSSNTPIAKYIDKISPCGKSMFFSPTDHVEIMKLIESLPNKTSTGFDDVSNVLLKELKDCICRPLSVIFNKSINNGEFPSTMKNSETIALHKSKEKHIVGNYRPISLLITVSKLLEKVVYKRTYSHLECNNQLYKSQYGFRSKHSCENAVSELVGEIMKANDQNKYSISVFLDLSKAFDTLDHKILYAKLERYGIRGICMNWFKSYLTDRKLRFKCRTSDSSKEIKSEWHQVDVGTPQGSVLGPLIFLIFNNDIYLNLQFTNSILFADDTTLYYSHKNLKYLKWCIEEDLKILQDWFHANKLTLNLGKTVAMLFNRRQIKDKVNLTVGGIAIPQVNETKFLGVWLDNRLNWNKHLSMLERKVKQNRHLLKGAKNMLNCSTKRLVYFSHIFSHIKYCILIWGNSLNGANIQKLQALQNSCVRLIKPNSDMTSLYRSLGILKIPQIIELENCKFGYKYKKISLPSRIQQLVSCDQNNKSLSKTHKYETRNKTLPKKPRGVYKQYSNSFLCNWIDDYSALPREIKNSKTLAQFANICKKLFISR